MNTRRRRTTKARLARAAAIYLSAIMTMLVMGFPLYGVILTSVQREADVRSPSLNLLPTYIELGHYREVLSPGHIVPLVPAMLNSLVVALTATFVAAALAAPAAYALYRKDLPGRRLLLGALVSIYVFPTLLFIIPLYILWVRVGLFDTPAGLVIPYAAFVLPIMVWNLGSFIRAIPWEVEEAAMLDGAGSVATIWRIIIPLIRPGLFAALILGFILSWIEFTTPLLFTNDLQIITVALGLYRSTVDIQIGQLAAAAVVTAMPVIILLVVFQRRIVEVFTAGVDR